MRAIPSLPWEEREAAFYILEEGIGFKVSSLSLFFLFVFLFSSKRLKFQKRFMIALVSHLLTNALWGFYSDNWC